MQTATGSPDARMGQRNRISPVDVVACCLISLILSDQRAAAALIDDTKKEAALVFYGTMTTTIGNRVADLTVSSTWGHPHRNLKLAEPTTPAEHSESWC